MEQGHSMIHQQFSLTQRKIFFCSISVFLIFLSFKTLFAEEISLNIDDVILKSLSNNLRLKIEKMSSAVPPTIIPHLTPNVIPDIKIITVINSIFGTISSEKPKPIANAEKIAARTKLFTSIFLFFRVFFHKRNPEIISS